MKEIISKDQICITLKTGVVFSGGSTNRSHDIGTETRDRRKRYIHE